MKDSNIKILCSYKPVKPLSILLIKKQQGKKCSKTTNLTLKQQVPFYTNFNVFPYFKGSEYEDNKSTQEFILVHSKLSYI